MELDFEPSSPQISRKNDESWKDKFSPRAYISPSRPTDNVDPKLVY